MECGRDSFCGSRDKDPATALHFYSYTFSVSLTSSLRHLFRPLPLSQVFFSDLLHYCHFQLHTLICTKTDEGLRRWKSLPPSHTLAHAPVSWPKISKYITSNPLSFWRCFHHVCVCVCLLRGSVVCMCVCPDRAPGFCCQPRLFPCWLLRGLL